VKIVEADRDRGENSSEEKGYHVDLKFITELGGFPKADYLRSSLCILIGGGIQGCGRLCYTFTAL
jgi:hypothetical protein